MRSRDILHKAKGESPWLRPLKSDGSWDDQAGGGGGWSLSLEAKSLKLTQDDYQARDYSDQMVLVTVRQEGGPCEWRPAQGLHSLRTLK
jgi:hypothetical protein